MAIRYINVDLDIESRMSLDNLNRELTSCGLHLLHCGPSERGFFARWECSDGGDTCEAESVICKFCEALESLGEPGSREWKAALGGANGELAAAMQYSIQGLNCDDPARKDMLMDIGTEELSHLEVVGTLARMHLKPMKTSREAAEADPLVAIAGGGGVTLCNSMGNPWTADYLKVTGELDVDLRSNIAAEARAKIVYERLINFTDDPGTKDALQFLMTREITHMKVFMSALESIGKDPLEIGLIPPTPGIVDQYFNDSTGENEDGDEDFTGPWNKSNGMTMVQGPAQPIAEATAREVQKEMEKAVKKSPPSKSKKSR